MERKRSSLSLDAIRIKRCNENAILPTRATAGSAGLDLYACIPSPIAIAPRELVKIPTGLAVALPHAGCVGLIFARSGLGVRHGISLSNAVGVIDSDYRGELQVGLCNLSALPYTVRPGERIAQLVVVPVWNLPLVETEDLGETERGEGGFGSSGR